MKLFAKLLILSQILLTSAFTLEEAPKLKVLLSSYSDGSLLEIRGKYKIYENSNHSLLQSSSSSHRYYLYPHEAGIKWGDNFSSVFQMHFVPVNSKTSLLVNGVQYQGELQVFNIKNRISIVNVVNVDDYLKATLGPKIPQNLDSEVIEALVILARTDLYNLIERNSGAYWHINKEKENYVGTVSSNQFPDLNKAVQRTKDMVLTYDNKPFAAKWTENCAGRTADYKTIFRKEMHCPKGVIATYAQRDRPLFKWEYRISKEELAQHIKCAKITHFDLFIDSKSDKVYAVLINEKEPLSFFTFQSLLGAKQIKSNDFQVKLDTDTVMFTGYGKGDGVGLCLYSAIKMAERGETAHNILEEFFPHTRLKKITSNPTY